MDSFLKHLENIKHASKKEKEKEFWNIEGIIKNKSNQSFKFDLRPISKHGNKLGKKGNTETKANKMVFDMKDQFIVVDTEELHHYLKEKKLKEVHLQDLISELEWNIILPK